MLSPTRLKVEGFRGFRDPVEFFFDNPSALLFGENHSAKSSTLNAIEWGLFGEECTGKATGIRERVGWVVPNHHMLPPQVSVELEMAGPDGSYVICRTLRRVGKKASLEESLELTLPDGEVLGGPDAEQRLGCLLQSSFRDFLTTVYQHQEVIRAVLTQEPKERNDAIDRLLGLCSQRNFLAALDATDLGSRHRTALQRFADFEQQIQTALAARENDLAELRQDAEVAGLGRSQLTGKAVMKGAQAVARAASQFANEAKLEAPELVVPEEWTGLAEFDKAVKKAIGRLRGLVPGIEEQKALLARQKQLLAAHIGLEELQKRWIDSTKQVRELDKKHGGRKAVDAKIAAATEKLEAEHGRLRQANGQAAVINEAIQFLEQGGDGKLCPVCGSDVPGLLEKIRRLWKEKLTALVERSKGKIDELKTQVKDLRVVVGLYQKLSEEVEQLLDEKITLHEQVGELLQRELGKEDDPLALVNGQLNRIDQRLQQLGTAIQERQERLDAIEQDLAKVRLVRDYLQQEAKKQALESIQESTAFRQLESLRDQMAELVVDVEQIKDAVAAVAREEAEGKLTTAEQTIDQYFRLLGRNPAVERLQLMVTTDKRTNRNAYDLTDQDGRDLMPILSQGDLNALALAIFLGLAATAKESGAFGFLMMDDPSQSLGTEHKRQLARLLDQIARHKKLIVATMDTEFHRFLGESLTTAKTEYHFGSWTPERGPSITTDHDPCVTNRRTAKTRAGSTGSTRGQAEAVTRGR